MQQHHATHALRPPHLRAATHHMHQQASAQPQHIAINLGPPQAQNAAGPPPPQQTHHMSNMGAGGGGVAAVSGPIMQLQHQQQLNQKSNYMQQQYNRLSHHHPQLQHQQQHQYQQRQHLMQKLRQQHQFVNNSNSSNNNNNNNNQKSNVIGNHNQQQELQQHMAGQPQQIQQHQRNIHHTTQHHAPNIKHKQQQQQQHQQQHTCIAQSANVIKTQPQQQQTQSHLQHQQQTQHSYATGNKSMYNNPNSTNNNNSSNKNNHNSSVEIAAPAVVVPKSILQNPNRASNNAAKQQQQKNVVIITPASSPVIQSPDEAATSTATTTQVPTKNKTEAAAKITPVVSAKSAKAETAVSPATDAVSNAVSSDDSTENEISQESSEKENNASTANNLCNVLPGNDVILSGRGVSNLAGASKEKTPMCLVNELARLNKITHQYRLTNEKGPAHCKSFTVTLKLGDEEYSAEGYKIKKAQHLAAAQALEKTKYEHPIPKSIRRSDEGGPSRATITPTVELNALAMKLGQPTYYLFDPRQQPPMDVVLPPPPPGPDMMYGPRPHGPPPLGGGPLMPPPPPPHHLLDPNNTYMRRHVAPFQRFNNYRGVHMGAGGYMHPNKIVRYRLMPPVLGHNGGGGGMQPHPHIAYPPPSALCKITLIVGKQKFIGTGRTLQAAKHDAASRALQVIREQAANQLNEILNRSMEESDTKSPISLVHEIGIKRNMQVHFKVLREEGPAHMKNFITACIAGSFVTEGCGNGKKISKKRAAEKMLEALKQLPPLSPTRSPIKRFKMKSSGKAPAAAAGRLGTERSRKRVAAAPAKDKSDTSTERENENPISKMIMLLQSRKEPEPIYELISKNGNETTRRREFIMEVRASGNVARGRGNNMKLAKRNAAQNLLEILSNESASTSFAENDGEIAADQTDSVGMKNLAAEVVAEQSNEEAVELATTPAAAEASAVPTVMTSSGQVPGILILRQHKKNSNGKNSLKHGASTQRETTSTATVAAAPAGPTAINTSASPHTVADAELSSKTADSIANASASADANSSNASCTSNSSSNPSSSNGLRMKKQLLYLAQVLGFDVDFSDYPKGNHNEFLTIVTLSTSPEQICHGTGATSEESQNDASKNALKILSDLNMNSGKAK